MSGSVIKFHRVVKHYGRKSVLSGVDLTVNEGEYFGLVGVNGAGKTTMIKCLMDFTRADSGTIEIFSSKSIVETARERLAYLPEKFLAPYYLTGKEFLTYMLRLYRVSLDQDKLRRTAQILDLEVADMDKEARKFSKGMSQKLGLAACLLSGRDLFVMDEPMSGLDPKARAYLKEYFMQLKAEKKTLFFSTHLLTDVEALCDRVAILHEGKVRFAGSPEECCKYYETDDFEQAYLKCVGDTGNKSQVTSHKSQA